MCSIIYAAGAAHQHQRLVYQLQELIHEVTVS